MKFSLKFSPEALRDLDKIVDFCTVFLKKMSNCSGTLRSIY